MRNQAQKQVEAVKIMATHKKDAVDGAEGQINCFFCCAAPSKYVIDDLLN